MVVCLALRCHTTGSPMQGIPDLQQHPLAILVPLMIPKPQLFDALRREKMFALLIALTLRGQAVLKAIQFD